MKTMPPKPSRLSVSLKSIQAGVDRKANVLRGYVVAQAGPFKSVGRGEFDLDSLRAIVSLGGKKPKGLRARFTHPDMSSDGLGTFLGRTRDLEMSKAVDARTGKTVDAVRGNLHFDPTALDTPPKGGKPLGIYVMDLAESDPDALSSSLVLEADEEWRKKKDGSLATDENGNDLPPLWRPKILHASDVVDTGDAVDGLLSADVDMESLSMSMLWKGAELLDSVFAGQPRDVVQERLHSYVERYLNRVYGEPDATPRLDAMKARLEAMSRRLAG